MSNDRYEIINKAFRIILPSLAEYIGKTLFEYNEKAWWNLYVLDKLGEKSTKTLPKAGSFEDCINNLDIHACLLIIIRNWENIFKHKMKTRQLNYVHLLLDIRNEVSHVTTGALKEISDEYVEHALDTMKLFMQPISQDIAKQIFEIKKSAFNVNDEPIKVHAEKDKNNMSLIDMIRTVGMSTFVKYYDTLEKASINDIVNILEKNEKYTVNTRSTKALTGKRIFRNNLQRQALGIISSANNVDENIKKKAIEIIKMKGEILESNKSPNVVDKKGKDNTKYFFNGKLLGKTPLVRAVIKEYIKNNNNMTLDELQKKFPGELQHYKGYKFCVIENIIEEYAEAERINGKRFNMKDTVVLKSGQNIVICNQWGIGNINKFIDRARELEFEITVQA